MPAYQAAWRPTARPQMPPIQANLPIVASACDIKCPSAPAPAVRGRRPLLKPWHIRRGNVNAHTDAHPVERMSHSIDQYRRVVCEMFLYFLQRQRQ
jgi:hypothetical protein